MDVHYFFNRRIAFIRQFYENAITPFVERIRKIEAGEEPFEPPYSENGEPHYCPVKRASPRRFASTGAG